MSFQDLLLLEYKNAVVFVTHATWVFPAADTMVVLNKGKSVAGVGSIDHFRAQGRDVSKFVQLGGDTQHEDQHDEKKVRSDGKPVPTNDKAAGLQPIPATQFLAPILPIPPNFNCVGQTSS
jgi:hypothetical protein